MSAVNGSHLPHFASRFIVKLLCAHRTTWTIHFFFQCNFCLCGGCSVKEVDVINKMYKNRRLSCSAKTLKVYSNSRKSSPSRTPVKKQTKVQSLLDPSRLRPPPITSPSSGELLSPNTRLNIALSMQQDHSNHHDDEILSISIPGESNVV